MILNLGELISVVGSEDSVDPTQYGWSQWLIVYINGSDVSSPILHGFETYPIMELTERKAFVVPPNLKNLFSNGKTSFR